MATDTATIVIVDDASEVRLLTKTRLRLSGRFTIVGEGSDGAEAVALAREHQPALMLLDVSMPGVDGLEALPQVLDASPQTRVVLYSGFEERGLVEKAHELGAAAFFEKSLPIQSLADRLLTVLDGGTPDGAGSRDRTAEEAADGGPTGSTAAADSSPEQQTLDEHLERFREVFDEAAIGMATLTLSGHIVRANRALARLMQRPMAELVGMSWGDLTEDAQESFATALDDIRRGGVDTVLREHGVRGAHDGRYVRTTLAPIRDSGGRALYLFLQVQDVTAEREATEEVRRSEERFRLLVETVKDYAIFMLDPGGHIVSWNAGAQRAKGYTAEDIIGRHFRVFYPPEQQQSRHPEHELELALRDGSYSEEGWRIRKDGSRFWANVVITAVFNSAGEHLGFAKVTRDMSDRRKLAEEREKALEALGEANAELQELNGRLRRAAEDQSQFLAVTAHELRTPIGVLGGSAETLSKYWPELTDEDRDELLDAMMSSTGRLRRLLADLLTASRLQASALEMKREPTLLSDVITAAAATVERTNPESRIVVEDSPDLPVSADRDRLTQAVENLLANALRHGSPPIRVSTRESGEDVDICVSDSGRGVAETMRPRLFERFATGRSKGGTGLGLYIVRELARAHDGNAFYEGPSAESPAGRFVIRLPRAGTDD